MKNRIATVIIKSAANLSKQQPSMLRMLSKAIPSLLSAPTKGIGFLLQHYGLGGKPTAKPVPQAQPTKYPSRVRNLINRPAPTFVAPFDDKNPKIISMDEIKKELAPYYNEGGKFHGSWELPQPKGPVPGSYLMPYRVTRDPIEAKRRWAEYYKNKDEWARKGERWYLGLD
jgi:hypothetical protein